MKFHLTKKVQTKIKLKELTLIESNSDIKFLNEWYVNLFMLDRKKYFIFTESKTLFSVVEDSKGVNDKESFDNNIIKIVGKSFKFAGYEISVEKENILKIEYCKTENKGVLGSQVDLIYMAKAQVWHNGNYDFNRINETPMSYIGYKFPIEMFREEMDKMLNSIEIEEEKEET